MFRSCSKILRISILSEIVVSSHVVSSPMMSLHILHFSTGDGQFFDDGLMKHLDGMWLRRKLVTCDGTFRPAAEWTIVATFVIMTSEYTLEAVPTSQSYFQKGHVVHLTTSKNVISGFCLQYRPQFSNSHPVYSHFILGFNGTGNRMFTSYG